MEFNRLVSLQQYPDPRRLDLRASLIDPYERWLVREYKQKSSISVLVILDLSASVRFNGRQDGVNLIAKILFSIITSVRRYGDRIGLLAFDNKFRKDWFVAPSQRVVMNQNEIIQKLKAADAKRGHKGLQEVANWLPKEKSLLFFLSDFHLSLNLLKNFLDSTMRHQVVPVVLEDEVEQSGYDRFGFAFLSDSETHRKKLVLLTKKFQQSLKVNYMKRNNNLISLCRNYSCRPVNILGDFDPNSLTNYFFGTEK